MTISYQILVTIVNLTNNKTKTFSKTFTKDIVGLEDNKLYNNYHTLEENVNIFGLFKQEIDAYCKAEDITANQIDIDEFNISCDSDKYEMLFEPGDDDDDQISLTPNIVCYIKPKYDDLSVPTLTGQAYDDTTIIWSWSNDGLAHYLVTEPLESKEESDKIIAELPIGTNTYTETGLEPNTAYTRRLISFNAESMSAPSHSFTVQTEVAPIDISLDQYQIEKNYDYTSDDNNREIINENLEAFHSGVGDGNDLKVYKQMDSDFYQKYKAYIKLRGERTQKEKRYDSVGFSYKVCLESTETVEEQKGEVTFDIDAYPRESVTIKDYMYGTQPVTVCARLECDVLVKKSQNHDNDIECPIEQPKWEKKGKRVKNEPNKYVPPKLKYDPLTVTFVIDNTKSKPNSPNGLKTVKDKACDLIDKIEKAKSGGKVTYSVITFATNAKIIGTKKVSATEAKKNIKGIGFAETPHTTCWGAGLNKANDIPKAKGETMAVFFYSDGGANAVYDHNVSTGISNYRPKDRNGHLLSHTYTSTDQGASKTISNDIKKQANDLKKKAHFIYPCVYSIDKDVTSGSPSQTFTKSYMKLICDDIKHNAETSTWHELNELDSAFTEFINLIATTKGHYELPNGQKTDTKYHLPDGTGTNKEFRTESGGWEFKGWEDNGQKVSLDADWNIDECKWAHVTIPPMSEDPWTITVNNSITPIVYARNEQRAIIPSDSIIVDRNFDKDTDIRQEAIQVDSRNLQDMILEELKQTADWQNGYNELVKAYTDEEKRQGAYIIRGLFIKDTYKYADEDKIPDINFKDDTLEDGYDGTFNVYADIEKMNTDVLGDDIYIVGTDKYVWASGYTEAIIYDGDRIASFELNAYDHPTDIILSQVDNYSQLMWNRKNKKLQYTGPNNEIYHAIDLMVKDKDIYLTGTDTLKKVGDWTLFVPSGVNTNDSTLLVRGVTYPVIRNIGEDIIAHNDEHYESPILNYRFALEDPDAYTNYYEILPTCDPDSPYKHIILYHIYYARNIYIADEPNNSTVYIGSFGDNNIATTSSPYYSNSQPIAGQTYFRDKYIDNFLWFQAKPMTETRPYYDEKPASGMDYLYGNVNGRYREDNKSGKLDLRVVTPQFNLPVTIDANDIRIYIMIAESYPKDALVFYKWDNPSSEKDSITKKNGDYVTFSSDTLVYKDITYNELIKTITTEDLELSDNKTTTEHFDIEKPLTKFAYDKYFVEINTNNGDVIPLNYPKEVKFDNDGKANIYANFKGVVNATTKWSPRLHNGYYYLNQHEYYAYSEFDVDANFEQLTEENYKNVNGYLTIDVDLIHKAGPAEHYDILKNTRSELIQDEQRFIWVNNKGLTIKPVIDGRYYKEYTSYTYTSPVLLFKHTLTSAGKLKVDYYFEDGSDFLPMQVRSYDIENGKWSDWTEFTNDTVPTCPLSCAYQVRFELNASVTNNDFTIEDYKCCYLDWKDDIDEDRCTNIVTITDHLQPGKDEADGIYMSKIIDFGCESTVTLDIFDSNISSHCALEVAISNKKNDLLIENAIWQKMPDNQSITVTTRYIRYRITVPYGEKLYWLHTNIVTKQSDVLLPYITGISMSGNYVPKDIYDSFQEVQSFNIITDGKEHKIFPSLYSIISGDVHAKGFKDNEIRYVKVSSTQENISFNVNSASTVEYPSISNLNVPIYATANYETKIDAINTPYIYASMNPKSQLDVIDITRGTPQQYAPITVEDESGEPFKEVYDVDVDTLVKTEEFEIRTEDDTHYIKLSRNDFDIDTLTLYLNDKPYTNYQLKDNLIIFNKLLDNGDKIKATYNILNSFFTEIDRKNNKTKITVYTNKAFEEAKNDAVSNLAPITKTKQYKELRPEQMVTNGMKFSYNTYDSYLNNCWKYDVDNKSIIWTQKDDNYSVLINPIIPATDYKLSFNVSSSAGRGNIIGAVIGYKKDASNVAHTISYIVALNKKELFDGDNTAIIYDYGTANQEVLAHLNVDREYNRWDKYPLTKFNIVKSQGTIKCSISKLGDPNTENADSTITYDLKSNDKTSIFTDSLYFGLGAKGQKNVTFSDFTLTANIDKTVSVEEQQRMLRHKYKVYFETGTENNKFRADHLSLNPVYRTDYKGFIYLTDEHNEPYTINIYCNPRYIKAGGYDKIDVAIECLDYLKNPVINQSINIDCKYGILNFDNTDAIQKTDINGVIHIVYESAVNACTDIITARTLTTDKKTIENSIEIVNE